MPQTAKPERTISFMKNPGSGSSVSEEPVPGSFVEESRRQVCRSFIKRMKDDNSQVLDLRSDPFYNRVGDRRKPVRLEA